MSKYKLTYFDFDGGRAEPIRIALHAAGVDFDDERISFQQFATMRASTPFNSVPVLAFDGAMVSQSNALCRYVGKMAGLYPTDDLQQLYCDEALDAFEDIGHYIVQTFGLQGEALKMARMQLVDGRLATYLRGLDALLLRGGKYFSADKLTIADLKSFVQIRMLVSGNLEHVPTSIVNELAPNLTEHYQRMQSEPCINAYYASRV